MMGFHLYNILVKVKLCEQRTGHCDLRVGESCCRGQQGVLGDADVGTLVKSHK